VKILIAAGGSGGHIFPAIALADELLKYGEKDIFFVASRRKLDKKILEQKKFRKAFLSINPMPYAIGIRYVVFIFKFLHDLIASFSILLRERPAVVIGFGGYTAGAILLLARAMGIKTIVHEQNLVPGRANRILDKVVNVVCVSFIESKRYFNNKKIFYTGNPLRQPADEKSNSSGYESFNLEHGRFTVLVMGGSQGARSLNRLAVDAIRRLDKSVKNNLQVLHVTGDKDFYTILDAYNEKGIKAKVFSFIDDIHAAYKITDLAISRSGASAIFELSTYGRPMVLVPYPFKKNSQRLNAEFFQMNDAAICMEEKALDGDSFSILITNLIQDKGKLKKLSEGAKKFSCPFAARELAAVVLNPKSE